MRKSCWLLIALVLLLAACGGGAEQEAADLSSKYSSLSAARKDLGTKLTRKGAAPQDYDVNEIVPAGVEVVTYKSGELELSGWLAKSPLQGKRPALVFLHGGFAFSSVDMEQVQFWVTNGWVVFTPIMRGENGNPGNYDLFFHEIDDVIAAGNYVAKLDNVDRDAIFVMGHSVGGTRALLASMLPGPFRAAASIGGATDLESWLEGQPELAPFDLSNTHEVWMRSPKFHIRDIQMPVIVARGEREEWNKLMTSKFVYAAQKAGKDVDELVVPGDHFTCFDEASRTIQKRFYKLAMK